jgi:hypothetical protein
MKRNEPWPECRPRSASLGQHEPWPQCRPRVSDGRSKPSVAARVGADFDASPTSAPIENDWGKPELLHNFLHQVRPLTLVIVCRRLAQPLSMIRGQVPMLARIGTPIAGATLGGVLVVRQASTPVYAMEPTMVWPACLLRPIGAVYLYCTQPPVPSGTVKIFIISFHPPHGHVHIHHRTQRCHRCRQYATTTHTHTHTRTHTCRLRFDFLSGGSQ